VLVLLTLKVLLCIGHVVFVIDRVCIHTCIHVVRRMSVDQSKRYSANVLADFSLFGQTQAHHLCCLYVAYLEGEPLSLMGYVFMGVQK